jgi:hypothetical protein
MSSQYDITHNHHVLLSIIVMIVKDQSLSPEPYK